MMLILSTLLAIFVMFGVPILWVVLFTQSAWNQRRLERARRYRAIHGTPWWIIEGAETQRRRKFLATWQDRTETLDV